MREMISAAAFVLLLIAAVPAATAAGTDRAHPSGSAGSTAEQVITGTVDSVDKDTGAVVINGQTLYIAPNGEMDVPKRGQRVTYVYEERDGRNVVTSFRQGQ
jgi:Cu/Ag efflux protein CusF